MGKIRIVFNRVGGNDDEKKNDVKIITTKEEETNQEVVIKEEVVVEEKVDVIVDNTETTGRENMKKLFSIILKLRAEGVQNGWNMSLTVGEPSEGSKLSLHAYTSPVGVNVAYIKGEGNRRELGTIKYSTVNQMIEEFDNMCSDDIKDSIAINKMSPDEFRKSMIDMESKRNEYIKSKKNSTDNMIEKSDYLLSLIKESFE